MHLEATYLPKFIQQQTGMYLLCFIEANGVAIAASLPVLGKPASRRLKDIKAKFHRRDSDSDTDSDRASADIETASEGTGTPTQTDAPHLTDTTPRTAKREPGDRATQRSL